LGRPVRGGGDREPRRDERPGPASLGAQLLVRPRAAAVRPQGLGGPAREQRRCPKALSAPGTDERSRPRRSLDPRLGKGVCGLTTNLSPGLTSDDDAPACRLYLLTPAPLITGGLELDDFLSQLDAALNAGDMAAFQLRLKDVPD